MQSRPPFVNGRLFCWLSLARADGDALLPAGLSRLLCNGLLRLVSPLASALPSSRVFGDQRNHLRLAGLFVDGSARRPGAGRCVFLPRAWPGRVYRPRPSMRGEMKGLCLDAERRSLIEIREHRTG